MAWLWLAAATLLNIANSFLLKKAEGFTVLWPSIGVIFCIVAAQPILSRAIALGVPLGLGITILCVCVMVGAGMFGYFVFGEPMPPQKIVGLFLAISGVAIATMAKA